MSHRLALTTAFLLGAGPVLAQGAPAVAASLQGACFEIAKGAWTPAVDLRADSFYVLPPSRVRLDTVAAARPGWLTMTVPAGALTSVHPNLTWRVVGDSIVLSFSTGTSGLSASLGTAGDSLMGTARTGWDFPRQSQTAPMILRRVACDAPQPSRPVERTLSRSVRLADGDSLTAGSAIRIDTALFELIPSRLPNPAPYQRTYRSRRLPVGLHAGATELRVTVAVGDTISVLRLIFPDSLGYGPLVERLSSVLGAPTQQSAPPPAGPPDQLTFWIDRTANIALGHLRMTAGGFTIDLMIREGRRR